MYFSVKGSTKFGAQTIFSTKYINMFHLALFSFGLQNILFDGPVGQQQADIPGISDAAISGLETNFSRGWPSL